MANMMLSLSETCRHRSALLFCASVLLLLGSCSYVQKITDGPTAYELKRYSEAVPLLTKEYNKTSSRVEQGQLAFMLGDSYEALHQPADALEWYRKAYDYQYGPLALERYAATLMQAERYPEALQAYKELGLEIGSRYQYRRQMQAAQLAIDFDEAEARYRLAATNFELPGPAYGPHVFGDQLLVASNRPSVEEEETYAWTGQGFSDLFMLELSGTTTAQRLEDRINGPFNEGAAAVSSDGQLLAFTRCAPMAEATGYCRIYLSTREGNEWSEPQPLEFQEDEVNYVQPHWSADGMLLYFSSDHPDAVGGYDLFTVERMPQQEWSRPLRLPRSINTQGNEHWPSLRGDTLFFASDGHAGFGGLDLFRTYRVGSDVWSNAFNLKPPVNSGGDDFGITFLAESKPEQTAGYLTSNRGAQGDRIYSIAELPPPPAPVVVDTQVVDSLPVAQAGELVLRITVVEDLFADPTNPSSRNLGKRPLAAASLSLDGTDSSAQLINVEPGQFTMSLKPNRNYRFLAKAEGYLSQDATFSTQGMKVPAQGVSSFELEIDLDKIFANREIVLDDIYYDFDKAEIRSDAKPTLRALARNLQLNPEIRIQMGSHTDCRGPESYNRELSQRRADAAVRFLIDQGVSPDRLRAVGYGEDRPRAECVCSRCSEDEHQLNRRTTFAILE